MKRCLLSYVMRHLQINTRYHYTPIRITQILKADTTNASKSVEQLECSFLAGGNAKWYRHFGTVCSLLQRETWAYYMIQQLFPKGAENI